MKKAVVLCLVAFFSFCAFAAQFHSVPVGHEAYRIIETAEIRGIVPAQTDVKPYNYNTVKGLLETIIGSDLISQSEKETASRVLAELDNLYGTQPTNSFGDLFRTGHLRTSGKLGTATIGGSVSFELTAGKGTDGEKVLDSRNAVSAYINGDILNYLSYDLNFKVNIDRIDTRATIPTDLRINTDGFYISASGAESGDDRLISLPDPNFYMGLETFSEMSSSINDDLVTVRIGTVRRDWGPGINNLALSGSARAFDAVELSIRPISWFSYSVATGSLGFVSLKKVNGVDWPSENMDTRGGAYYNNLSIHRVELGPFSGFRAAIWESVVWRKRFEISYLNPLAIYMFAQNGLGDYDNCLAGFDFTFTWKGVGEFYAAMAMDEINNIHVFTSPRDMIALQAGVRFSPGFLDFSELTLQATYVPAFFGAHYSTQEKLFGDVYYTTAYVNKGQNIGYPVNPDTLELLASFHTSFGKGWKLGVDVKEQLRSAQYSAKETGSDVLTFMSYKGFYQGKYKDRDFFGNIWNSILSVDLSIEKKFSSFPMSLSLGVRGIWDKTRNISLAGLETDDSVAGHEFQYNPGDRASFGEWEDTFTLNGVLCVSIYY